MSIISEKVVNLKYQGEEYPKYAVHDDGRIISPRGNRTNIKYIKGREYISISANGKPVTLQVPLAMMESFNVTPHHPDDKFIGFYDGDPTNNAIHNLFWTNTQKWWLDAKVTISSNVRDKILKEVIENSSDNIEDIAKSLNYSKSFVNYVIEKYHHVLVEIRNTLALERDSIIPDVDEESLYPEFMYADGAIGTSEELVELHQKDNLTETENYIVEYDIPALRYAGVKKKKMLDYILYKYGRDLYELIKSKHLDKLK